MYACIHFHKSQERDIFKNHYLHTTLYIPYRIAFIEAKIDKIFKSKFSSLKLKYDQSRHKISILLSIFRKVYKTNVTVLNLLSLLTFIFYI